MARIVLSVHSDYARKDAKEELEKLGFVIVGDHDKSYYDTHPPLDWFQEPYNDEYVVIIDGKKQRRIIQFFGGEVVGGEPYMYIDSLPTNFSIIGRRD